MTMVFKPKSYENKANWQKGWDAEKRFMIKMLQIGVGCRKASLHHDLNYHVDFFVGGNTPVDLKGNKKTDAIWLEKRNVYGGRGSIMGFAKYIVMDLIDIKAYVFYDRLDLVKYVKRFTDICKHKSDYYCLYTRDGNKDQIIKVRETDLKNYERFRIQY